MFSRVVQSLRKPVSAQNASVVESVAGGRHLSVHGFTLPHSLCRPSAGMCLSNTPQIRQRNTHKKVFYIQFLLTVCQRLQVIFQIRPLSWSQWVVVLKMSLPVIFLDEALKFLARNYVDPGNQIQVSKSTIPLFF